MARVAEADTGRRTQDPRLLNETLLIGALLRKVHISEVAGRVQPEMLVGEDHGKILQVMQDLDEEAIQATAEMVAQRIRKLKSGAGPVAYLTACAHAFAKATDFSLDNVIGAIREDWVARELEKIGKRLMEGAAKRAGNAAIMADAEIEMLRLRDEGLPEGEDTMAQAGRSFISSISDSYQNRGGKGVPWGFEALSRVAAGDLEEGNTYGILFDSGGGKTSISLQILRMAAERGYPGLFLSYEQSKEQCIRQMVSQRCGIPVPLMKAGKFSEAQYLKMVDDEAAIRQLPLFVETVSNMGARDLVSVMRRYQRKHGKVLVVIDHAKSVRLNYKIAGFAEQVSDMYRTLRDGARQLNLPTIVLMQRLRDALARDNPAPTRNDAYGGSAPYETLDVMIGMYRPVQAYEMKKQMTSRTDVIADLSAKILSEAKVARAYGLKVRYGKSDLKEDLEFEPEFTRFSDVRRGTIDPSIPRYEQEMMPF